jgi:hypothetical protein
MRSKVALLASVAVAASAAGRFADFLSNEVPANTTKPVTKRASNAMGGRSKRVISTFNLTAQAIGDRLMLPRVPKGARGVHHALQPSVALGAAATLALGVAGNTGKYRAAAIKNDTAREVVSSAVNISAELAADEDQFLTVAAAALPNGGTLVVETFYNL